MSTFKKIVLAVALFMVMANSLSFADQLFNANYIFTPYYDSMIEQKKKNPLGLDMEKINKQYKENMKKLEEEKHTLKATKQVRRGVDRYSDLSNKYITINKDQMNKIIENWENRNGYTTVFHNHGEVFIEASKSSGLDPLYIFAHAMIESGWGTSHYAVSRANYFGIAAYDYNPDNASYMSDSMEEGMVNGAKWIATNYYTKGAYCLERMKSYGYATDPNWENSIEYVWNNSYAMYWNLV